MLLPTADGIAILHATDLKFNADSDGKNIMCTNGATDLQKSYGATYQQTENVTTYMQVWK